MSSASLTSPRKVRARTCRRAVSAEIDAPSADSPTAEHAVREAIARSAAMFLTMLTMVREGTYRER